MRQLRLPSLLEELGLSGPQRSALGELLGCDCETMGRNALQPTVTLHDLTSTCFEGAADRQPLDASGATHPGVHGLRTNSVGWDAERLWRTCVTRTDLEAVFRSLGSALGLRPIHHRRPARSAGHLCLSVLACQLVQVVRQRLRAGGETASWTTLRHRLAGQQRVTAVFRQADGRVLPARKATRAESWQRAIYERLGWTPRRAGSASWSSSPDGEGNMHGMQCHTPDSAAAMCSLQTTYEMKWQTWARIHAVRVHAGMPPP